MSPLVRLRRVLLFCVLVLFVALAACEGCHGTRTNTPSGDAEPQTATLRLYLVSDLAGALEPCGCVKDQLGGMDHFGALVTSEKQKAPASVLLSAGPTFFLDPF